jgi:hypothetical protein
VIAWLKRGTGLKSRLDGLLGGFDLLLELVQTATKRQKQFQLYLGNAFRCGEWNNGEFRLRENF